MSGLTIISRKVFIYNYLNPDNKHIVRPLNVMLKNHFLYNLISHNPIAVVSKCKQLNLS
jgi:hypothetical protein